MSLRECTVCGCTHLSEEIAFLKRNVRWAMENWQHEANENEHLRRENEQMRHAIKMALLSIDTDNSMCRNHMTLLSARSELNAALECAE